MQITGHKNVETITSYDSKLSFEEQKQYSNILTGSAMTACSNAVSSTGGNPTCSTAVSNESQPQESATTPNMGALFHGATFNNCTFNLKC